MHKPPPQHFQKHYQNRNIIFSLLICLFYWERLLVADFVLNKFFENKSGDN